jgi:iron(III) transport system permease protein
MARIDVAVEPRAWSDPLARLSPRGLGRLISDHGTAFLITAVLLWVVGAPIVFLLAFSFRGGSVVEPGALTLANYAAVYSNKLTYSALANTVIFAGVVSVVGLGLATLFAWLAERTDMPGRNWAWSVMLVPLAMPGMLSSMAWILLLSPKTGIVNLALRGLVHSSADSGPFNIFSLSGMIFVESVRGSTTLFLMMVAAFRLMDPSMEEAAVMAGAPWVRSLRKITLGLVLPTLLAAWMYSFLGQMEDFETPLLIGLPAGVYVLPTLIFFTAYGASGPQHGLASAYTSIFLVLTVLLVVVYYRVVLRKASRYASITGKGFRPRRLGLGAWRYPALGVFGAYFLATIALPLLMLIWASLMPTYETPSLAALGKITLANYGQLLQEDQIVGSLVNTLVVAVSTATATMGLAFLVSWLVVRLKVRGGLALDALSFIPHAIPTVAIGLALVIFYLNPAVRWLPVYGTVWILTLALMTRYLAFGSRSSNAAMTQVSKELEEAASMGGAGKIITMARITTPLLIPAFLSGWIWVAAHAFRNLTIPLMLSTPKTQTIATILYYYWQRKAEFSLASALGVTLLVGMGIVIFAARRLVVRGYSEAT